MKKKTSQTQLNSLSEQIGGFIEYWGFKKIHGMIWTHLYLSPVPLSAQELITRLRVSKALVSLSMKDLLHYQLILQTEESLNKKNKFYIANPDVFEVIRGVLQTRELQMMGRIENEFNLLSQTDSDPSAKLLDQERMQALGLMIEGAHSSLKSLIQLAEVDPSFLLGFCGKK